MSITPKVLLHDLTADHKDEVSVILHCHDQHIDKVGFTCDCNNLVCTSPYTVEPTFTVPTLQAITLAEYQQPVSENIFRISLFFASLRGPPAAGKVC